MKKLLFILCILPYCAHSTEYSYMADNNEYINQGTKVYYVPKNSYTGSTEMQVTNTALQSSGLYPVNLDEYMQRVLNGYVSEQEMNSMTNLRAFISIKHRTVRETINMPVQNNSSIGSFDSRMIGDTLHTNVNYNNQIVGYQPMEIDRDLTCLYFGIRHHKEKVVSYPTPHSVVEDTPFVHWSQICAYGYIDDITLLNDAISIYRQNNITYNTQKAYRCNYSRCSEIK